MNIIKKISAIFTKTTSKSLPLLIIQKDTDQLSILEKSDVKEYMSIEEAISDLEKDINVSSVKIEKLKASLKKLKNKTSITIRNGEIV